MSVRVKQTSIACPEQYDIFDADDESIGHVRLRHGTFKVERHGIEVFRREFPVREEAVLEPEEDVIHVGEYHDGVFCSDIARDAYLSIALRKVLGEPLAGSVLFEFLEDELV